MSDITGTLLPKSPGQVDRLADGPGSDEGRAHVWDGDSILAVDCALATERALLVRGDPGTGKTQLAEAVARALDGVLVSYTVDSRTEPRDLKWWLDVVARLAEAQVAGALPPDEARDVRANLAPSRFVHPGPLWWAFDPGSARSQAERVELPPETWAVPPDGREDRAVVLLVDEIDKADPSVPNGLLDALGYGWFDVTVPGCGRVARAVDRLLVVITTNEERALPDAFLRRCVVLTLEQPDRAGLIARGTSHFPDVKEGVLGRAADQVLEDRERAKAEGVMAPGLAEYLDLVRAVRGLRPGEPQAQAELLEQVRSFFLRKHPEVRS